MTKDHWRSLAMAGLAFGAATLCGARILRGVAARWPIHAAGFWRIGSGELEPWTMDLVTSGNALSGEFSGQRDLFLVGGRVRGEFSREIVVLTLETDSGKPLAIAHGSVEGATVSGTIDSVPNDSATAAESGDWKGTWYADPPSFDATADATPAADDDTAPPNAAYRTFPNGVRAAASAPPCNDYQVNASSPTATQNEPELGVDRLVNPDRLVAAAIDYSLGPPQVYWYYSPDAGVTWPAGNRGPIPIPAGANKCADPSVEYDTQGRPFIGALAYREDFGAADMTAVIVARSADHGASFSSIATVTSALVSSGESFDKPWMAVDRSVSSPNHDNVYVAWSRTTGVDPTFIDTSIRFARSSPGGASFSILGTALRTANTASDRVVGYPILTTAADGTVYAIWAFLEHAWSADPHLYLEFDRCVSGGATCGGAFRRITEMNFFPENRLPSSFINVGTIPSMAVDSAGGAAMYIVWNEFRRDLAPSARNGDIYFTRSIDNGDTWTPKAALVSDSLDEFMPAVTVDSNHFVRVTYYRRTSPSSNSFNAYEVSSANGGVTFSAPIKLNCGPDITPIEGGIGDYIGNDAAFLRHHVWMDTRQGSQDVYLATTSGC